MTHKAKTIYYLVLYRKSLQTPAVVSAHSVFCLWMKWRSASHQILLLYVLNNDENFFGKKLKFLILRFATVILL